MARGAPSVPARRRTKQSRPRGNWLCFRSPKIHRFSHNLFPKKQLASVWLSANWLCFARPARGDAGRRDSLGVKMGNSTPSPSMRDTSNEIRDTTSRLAGAIGFVFAPVKSPSVTITLLLKMTWHPLCPAQIGFVSHGRVWGIGFVLHDGSRVSPEPAGKLALFRMEAPRLSARAGRGMEHGKNRTTEWWNTGMMRHSDSAVITNPFWIYH